jgi:hypothetical protein
MALERKDVRVKLDAEWHTALAGVAEADQCDIGEWVENLIVRSLRERFDSASVLVAIAQRSGISGKVRE